MPQGNWTTSRGAGGGVAGARWAMRPMLALSLLAMLAACGQTHREAAPRVATYGSYNRPASYDPPGPSDDPWGPWIREASRRFDVPERWIRAVMRQESAGRAQATSRAGAMGLMQVMPATYRELQYRYGLGDDPYHPYDNIMAGTAYIREMYELYGSPAFLAAYNAGPRRLEDYLWNGRGLPRETRNYVARIGPNIVSYHPNRRARPEVYAAAEIPLNIPPGPRRMDSATMLALREQREAVDPGIQVAQLPPGPVVRMDPIPDGSTSLLAADSAPAPVPYQIASAGPVVRMDPIPDGSTAAGAARLAEAAAREAESTTSSRAPTALVATLPPPAPRTRSTAASGRNSGLGLVGTAHASTLPTTLQPAVRAATGDWAVQVGAFSSRSLAQSMAGKAHGTGGGAGRVMVQRVAQGRSTLYRARVIGLSQSSAHRLCERLQSRGDCMVLSPDAQG